MKWIPPDIRLINPISKHYAIQDSHSMSCRKEQSQDLMLRSTTCISFLDVTYHGPFLSFNHLSNWIFPCPLQLLTIYAMCMYGICL